MAHVAPEIFNGLILGAFYAVVAIGLSLIMNLTGTINMAHGSFMTLSGYLAFALVGAGTNWWFALAVAPILTVVVGIAMERTLIRPLYRRDPGLQFVTDLWPLVDCRRGVPAYLGHKRRPIFTAACAAGRGLTRLHLLPGFPAVHRGGAPGYHPCAGAVLAAYAHGAALARRGARPRDDRCARHEHPSALHVQLWLWAFLSRALPACSRP